MYCLDLVDESESVGLIQDHLIEPQAGGRDYVGSMYQAYEDHLRGAGVRKLPCGP